MARIYPDKELKAFGVDVFGIDNSIPLQPKIFSSLYSPEEFESFNMEKAIQEKAASVMEEKINGSYILMPQAGTYAHGVHSLRDACEKEENCLQPLFTRNDGSSIFRPLTFRENIEARVNDYNTVHNPDGSERKKKERLRLFARWLDSCTGIAYKAETTKFKIIRECSQLIAIRSDVNQKYLPVNYDEISGIELDSNDSIYDQHLTQHQVENNPGWIAAVEDDIALLKDYSKIVFYELNRDNAMAFCVMPNIEMDKLLALLGWNLISGSVADGFNDFYHSGSFLRLAQPQKFSTGNEG